MGRYMECLGKNVCGYSVDDGGEDVGEVYKDELMEVYG